MKLVLDERATRHLKPHLTDFEVFAVREMEWGGIKNGKLMALSVEHGFDVLLTMDKDVRPQQNLDKYPLTVVVLNSFTSKLEELVMFLPAFRKQAVGFQSHNAYVIETNS